MLSWNRELFEGIYRPCEQAIKEGLPLEAAKTLVLKDPRVASRAKDTKGFEINIGKYVSLAYLEAEAAGLLITGGDFGRRCQNQQIVVNAAPDGDHLEQLAHFVRHQQFVHCPEARI